MANPNRDGPYRRKPSPFRPQRCAGSGGGGAAVSRADERRLDRRNAEQSGSGHAAPVVRSWRRRNRLLPQVRRQLIRKPPCCALGRLVQLNARAGRPQGPSSSGTAWRELRKAGPCGCCDNGYHRANGPSSPTRAVSRLSAATPASDTGSMQAPRPMSASSMNAAARHWGCVFCRWAICRSGRHAVPEDRAGKRRELRSQSG
jgi:hypothetical protein